MSRGHTLTVLLAAMVLGLGAMAPGAASAEPGDAPHGVGGWGFVSGGVGAMVGARTLHPMGRFSAGIGGNLVVVYGSLSAELSVSPHQGFVLLGVGSAGFVIPIPAFKPMLGFKAGLGLQADTYGPSPALTLGPQLGVHIGQIGGSRFGIRLMLEPAVTIATASRIGALELVGTFGVLF